MSSKSDRTRQVSVFIGVTVLLLIILVQLGLCVRQESINWDEGDHLFSGYMSWKHFDFGLNPEHPPLVKLVAALPLLGMDLKVPQLQNRQFKTETFLDGKRFAAENYSRGILFRARMAASVFMLLLGLLVFLAAKEMFGTTAGFIALTLFSFDPNLLAHGAFVTTDMGVSCFIFASVYAFYRSVKAPSLFRVIVAGVATGCALGSKHTGILLLPILLALVLCEIPRGQKNDPVNQSRTLPRNRSLRLIGVYALTIVLGFSVLWSFYGFRYSARPAGQQINPPLAESLRQLSKPTEAKVLGTAAHLRLLPESYLYGMGDIQTVDDAYTAYFFGKTYLHGIWLYFPAVIAIKSTLPLLLLLILAAVMIAARRLNCWREILFLTIPPAIYLIVAMCSQMNIGIRHILPIYPFLYVLVSGAAALLIRSDRRWVYAIIVLLLWQIAAALRAFPSYMAYANELWGGAANTHKYLSDSNVDWGQQLIGVKHYLDEHGIQKCWFVYFPEGAVDMRPYGIPCKPLPTADTLWWLNEELDAPPEIDGPLLISDGDLAGFEFGPGALNPYEQFKSLKPDAVIQHGVYVFNGHFAIPLAAAYSRAQKAQNLLDAKQLDRALIEAQQAVRLAPDAVFPNTVLGDVWMSLKRPNEARASYETALKTAKTVEPEFQAGAVTSLEQKYSQAK